MATTENGIFIPDPIKDRAGVYLAERVRQLSPNKNLAAPDAVPGFVNLKLPIAAATADAEVLYTTPKGLILILEKIWWQMTADWTGGSSSAIGVSASAAPHTTKGDLLGGGSGDVAAALTAAIGHTQGTIGVSFSAAPAIVILPAETSLRFDRITSAFTAGAGFVRAVGRFVPA